MDIIKIVIFCLIAVVILRLLKQYGHDSIAVLFAAAVGVLVFIYLINYLGPLLNLMREITAKGNMNFTFLDTLLKVIGIAYIAEFGSQICKDANENLIAAKIELAGKVFILLLAVPIILLVLESILNFLP